MGSQFHEILNVMREGGGAYDKMTNGRFQDVRVTEARLPSQKVSPVKNEKDDLALTLRSIGQIPPGPERAAALQDAFGTPKSGRYGSLSSADFDWIIGRCAEDDGPTTFDDIVDELAVHKGIETLKQCWDETVVPDPVLQKCSSSKLHDLLTNAPHDTELLRAAKNARVFLVQHNWAAAFGDEFDKNNSVPWGDIRMPAELCAFEFCINGAHCILLVNDNDKTLAPIEACDAVNSTCYVKLKNGDWIWPHPDWAGSEELETPTVQWLETIFSNVVCALIALEAQVVNAKIVRAPHKPNMARIKKGKPPIFDYHVLSLAHRSRPAPLPDDAQRGTHASPRLHFRRGHWRHYENHKTWIEWTLVGNPNLGFVDKDYRL